MMGRPTKMPTVDTPEYHKLVVLVAAYGWRTGSQLAECATYTAFYRWRSLAACGVEPYATWIPRFQADLRAAKARL
jgi:hypothetical protein